jgi:aspartyl-tRNA synthetase
VGQKTKSKRYVRSHDCGELRGEHVGKTIELCGWASKRRDHGGVIFIDLRDRYGITQIVFDPSLSGIETHTEAGKIRSEFVIWCRGKVRARPEGMANNKRPTGGIEIICDDLYILSEAKTPPFEISDDTEEVTETTRLKYRYLDLRRNSLQNNMMIRHKLYQVARNFLTQEKFMEIETPILYKSTPEGARDFIVPSRISPGNFYALPQSPQTLKQLLMISGFDRYFQIARCFRDEDLRADRQPEFSQIDIEFSFMDEEAFFPIMEKMVAKIWKEILGVTLETPFPQLPYEQAMSRYGSDKPDVRFGLEIQDLSSVFASSTFKVFQSALQTQYRGQSGSVRCIHVQGHAEKFSRKDLDDLTAHSAKYGSKGLLWIKVQADGVLQSPAAKFFTDAEKQALAEQLKLKSGDLILIVADPKNRTVCEALGAVRLWSAEKLGLIPTEGHLKPAFLWVTRFPLLEYNDESARYFACHHPFTLPSPEHLDDFLAERNLDKVQAAAYDLVLNGVEVAGGSLRIYRSEVQAAMFKTLGISPEEAKLKFGFFIEALQYGTPPHGGMAFGVDRLAAILCGVGPIRDVMAFPKTQKGHCLMSESPSEVSIEQLFELGISLKAQPKK